MVSFRTTFTAVQATAFSIQDDFVYVAVITTTTVILVYRLNQITTGMAGNVTPVSAIDVSEPGFTFMHDLKACGNVLVISYTATSIDFVRLVDISDPNNIALGNALAIPASNSAGNQAIASGLVRHPTANVVYVINTKNPATNGLDLNVIQFTQDAGIAPILVETFNNPTLIDRNVLGYINVINSPLRLRPRYCDGALQTLYPAGGDSSSDPGTPAKCYLDTYCVDDCDPTNVSLVSRQVLANVNFDNCFPRHIATSTGRLILTGQSTISMYDAAASAQRYLNKKPMNLPSSVNAKYNQGGFIVLAGTNTVLLTGTNTFENFGDIGENAFLTGVSPIFVPSRPMIVHVDIFISDDTVVSTTLQFTINGTPLLKVQKNSTGILHYYSGLLSVTPSSFTLVSTSGADRSVDGGMEISMRFERYV